jgi:hypothetical protein
LVGTTLVEVLVVIVILLVGILAVVQVFPKGFLLLSLSRKSAQASALAREESERLKTRADLLPEMVLAVNGSSIDSSVLPSDLGPAGASVGEDGSLYDANNNLVGNWASHSGANRFRLIIGETHRVALCIRGHAGLRLSGVELRPCAVRNGLGLIIVLRRDRPRFDEALKALQVGLCLRGANPRGRDI